MSWTTIIVFTKLPRMWICLFGKYCMTQTNQQTSNAPCSTPFTSLPPYANSELLADHGLRGGVGEFHRGRLQQVDLQVTKIKWQRIRAVPATYAPNLEVFWSCVPSPNPELFLLPAWLNGMFSRPVTSYKFPTKFVHYIQCARPRGVPTPSPLL